MKLLIITQKVDERDQVLGFMHRWIEEFAKRCEALAVICLEEGTHHLPQNVKVFSLGKERGSSRLRYALRFWYLIWRERNAYDAVFVHMNQIYVILGWLEWRLLRKKISLWYAHGAISMSLRAGEKMADVIFTSTASGFRLPSKKVRIVGQGIDTDHFAPIVRQENVVPKIIMIGRLSPAKDQQTLIQALVLLAEAGERFEADIIGSAGRGGQESYAEELYRAVKEKKMGPHIRFIGGVPHKDILVYLQSADIFVNTGLTGSLDKAGLEAMATGLPVLTCNEAYMDVLGKHCDLLMFEKKNSVELAKKLMVLMHMDILARDDLRHSMRAIVVEHHRVEGLIEKIMCIMELKI
ncbi:MAG: glycosyltransferase family 4 protein [Candidatus Sungbacteria bacterium]|nr:glycosyltransferase family 4 protein [Candidatus Sungbacteria bacterium]